MKEGFCTARTKPYHVVRNVNRLLNDKIRMLGFQAVPPDTEFVAHDKKDAHYISRLPIVTQNELERE